MRLQLNGVIHSSFRCILSLHPIPCVPLLPNAMYVDLPLFVNECYLMQQNGDYQYDNSSDEMV